MFMSRLEINMLRECRLDDIFFVWSCMVKNKLLDLFEYISSYHETIKYTWKWSESKISYLQDILVAVKGNKISNDVLCKPTVKY